MTIHKEKLKALAEQSALEPKWYEAGSHGLKNVSHLHDREFIAAASPATVLALLAEIERLEQCLFMESAELAWSDSDGRAIQAERDQLKVELAGYQQGAKAEAEAADEARAEVRSLKAENEALRDGANYRAIQSLRADCEALRKDAERYRFVRSPLGTSSPLAIWNEGKMPLFSGMADACIDAAMAKEASQ